MEVEMTYECKVRFAKEEIISNLENAMEVAKRIKEDNLADALFKIVEDIKEDLEEEDGN